MDARNRFIEWRYRDLLQKASAGDFDAALESTRYLKEGGQVMDTEKARELLAAYKGAMREGRFAAALQAAQELGRVAPPWSLARGPSRWDALAQQALRAARMLQTEAGLRVAEELGKILTKGDDDNDDKQTTTAAR